MKWIGAEIEASHQDKSIKVTIPKDKVSELKTKVEATLKKPVIGRKQLQS